MNEFVDSLVIIIVIYNTNLDDSESFQSIRQFKSDQKDINLFVYDNSNHPQNIRKYSGLNITYFYDSTNSGVSRAYNFGAAHAKESNKKWILLLDQDTKLPNTILNAYFNKIHNHQHIKLFVPILQLSNGKIFSPCTYRFKRGFYLKRISPGIHSLFNLAPVNSGMLIDVNSFYRSGGYNERVKLDFSDFQFIERFRKIHKNFYVLDLVCQQDFSNEKASLGSQLSRFVYYCEGARNMEKDTFVDWAQYAIIVLLRSLRLTVRYGKLNFVKVYLNVFFGRPKSGAKSGAYLC